MYVKYTKENKKKKNNSYISYILYICILIFIFFVWPFLHALSLFIYITIFVCLEQCSFVFSWWTCRSSDCFFFTILIINLTSVCLCIRSDSCFRFFFLFLFKLINYCSKANLKYLLVKYQIVKTSINSIPNVELSTQMIEFLS